MLNETIRIFFPLKIVSYPQFDPSEDDRDEISPEEAVEYKELILTTIEKITAILKTNAGWRSILIREL